MFRNSAGAAVTTLLLIAALIALILPTPPPPLLPSSASEDDDDESYYTASLRSSTTRGECWSNARSTRKECQAKAVKCDMKWTGSGCIESNTGKRWFDGGCQHIGYCDYHCASACKQDKECYWDGYYEYCF